MNFVIPTSQPAPTIYSRRSCIIAVTSVIVILTLIVALILQCIKSWHINFISEFTSLSIALAHLCWVVSTVNMLSQDISKRLIRLNQAALIVPNAVIVALIAVMFVDSIFFDIRYPRIQRELMTILIYVSALTVPTIAWLTNTVLVIRSMIKVHALFEETR